MRTKKVKSSVELIQERPKNTDRWSEDGQIFFHFGKGYGLTPGLRTVCLGTEEEIKKQFADIHRDSDHKS